MDRPRQTVHGRFLTATPASSSSSSPEPPADDETDDFFTLQKTDSQSSLGIGSVRERSTSPYVDRPDRPKNPIDRLPAELLISVLSKLSSTQDLLNCMLVSRKWSLNTVDLLWHRPSCNNWKNLVSVVGALRKVNGYFHYHEHVKRLNLSNLSEDISDGTILPFTNCKRIERLTLTGCSKMSDQGVIALVDGNRSLLALDITGLQHVTDLTLLSVAENCNRLQGLNITDCSKVTDDSLVQVAMKCKYLKRLKLNKCLLVTDESISSFARCCPSMLEIDLQDCRQITDVSVTALISRGRHLRELRLAQCSHITDNSFLQLPPHLMFDSLRILDLTSCHQLRDESVEKIISTAPRLRNLVLAKCKEITDLSVLAITRLGKNLHYIHLGHCQHITDNAVIELVKYCNRIRYIDLACCHRLTDNSVMQLATLPKLRRIGLVKCQSITDRSIMALAKVNNDPRAKPPPPSYLERVHLSYCVHLTLGGIHHLLNHCPKLTHLSLTGVQAFFLREDLINFCREAPPEFTDHQRNVFCVFSGEGVGKLRDYLNLDPDSLYPENGETMYDDGTGGGGAEDDDTVVGGNAMLAGHHPMVVGPEQLTGFMAGTQIGDDGNEGEEGDFEIDEGGDGSVYGGEGN